MRPSPVQTVVVQSDEVSRVVIIDGTTVIRYFRVKTDNRFRRGAGGCCAAKSTADRIHQLVGITKVIIPSGSIDLRVLIAII